MTHVTIIGSGNMGQAISGLVSKGGNTVELLRHSDTSKPVTGDIVVLAVPHAAIPDILATRGDGRDPPGLGPGHAQAPRGLGRRRLLVLPRMGPSLTCSNNQPRLKGASP